LHLRLCLRLGLILWVLKAVAGVVISMELIAMLASEGASVIAVRHVNTLEHANIAAMGATLKLLLKLAATTLEVTLLAALLADHFLALTSRVSLANPLRNTHVVAVAAIHGSGCFRILIFLNVEFASVVLGLLDKLVPFRQLGSASRARDHRAARMLGRMTCNTKPLIAAARSACRVLSLETHRCTVVTHLPVSVLIGAVSANTSENRSHLI
jgi:hypothetical protein